ncbi:MAG: hypothetical protein KHX55_02435 [Proteobacteria bacterium]|nr:hypothetical protein [Pseudomonadota bacterium]
MNNLVFKSHTFTPIFINGLPFLGYPQIADALQYRNARIISDLYNRHADEFTPDMSFLTTVDTAGGKQQVRVFSLRGCHLLAMFSKTPVAKEFRRWVLDLIEQHNATVRAHQPDMKAIGGAVKRCAAVAVRQEISKAFENILSAAEKVPVGRPVSDEDLVRCLWSWYATHHAKTLDAIREQERELDELKRKLLAVKQAVK